MELTDEMRNEMKVEIPREINGILERYELPYRMDQVAIMNSSNKISFIGNVRVHEPSKVKPVQEEVESYLKKFGEVAINTRKVVPCCELPYTYINFHITYSKD